MPDPDDMPLIGPVWRATTFEERSQVPILGETLDTMNAVINFVEYGCYPTWTVWVDTLWPCAGRALLQFFSFGWGDILRGYFRPTHIRGAGGLTRKPSRSRKGKAGKSGRLGRLTKPPEIGNMIGRALPGAQVFAGRKVSGTERIIWILDFQVQRVLWYWLVFDLVADFVQCWSSSIMKSEACARDSGGSVSASRSQSGPWAPGSWHAILGWNTLSDTTDGLWNPVGGTLSVPLGKSATVSFIGDARVVPTRGVRAVLTRLGPER